MLKNWNNPALTRGKQSRRRDAAEVLGVPRTQCGPGFLAGVKDRREQGLRKREGGGRTVMTEPRKDSVFCSDDS